MIFVLGVERVSKLLDALSRDDNIIANGRAGIDKGGYDIFLWNCKIRAGSGLWRTGTLDDASRFNPDSGYVVRRTLTKGTTPVRAQTVQVQKMCLERLPGTR